MIRDFRYALRTLWMTRRFTVMAILVLALGIGANSAIFTVVYSVLLHSLPYADPSRLAVILASSEKRGGTMPVTPGDFFDYRDQNHSFDEIGAASVWSPTLTGTERAEKLDGLNASVSLFRILGVQPALGRLFVPEDGRADAPAVVVLTYNLFRQRFGGDPQIVGRSLILDGKAHTVVGVTPPGFYFPPFWALKADIYAPATIRPSGEAYGRGPGYLRMFGRLKSGVSMEQARAEMKTIASRLAREYPRTNAGLTATVTPIHEMSVGSIRPVLLVLLGAVACTLLIACANIANLLIARASARRRELAIRQSLGAGRFHLIRQSLAETTVLAVASGLLGLTLAWWAVPVFVASIPEFSVFRLPRQSEIRLSGAVVLFNFSLCAGAALFCGLITALNAGWSDLKHLRDFGRGQVGSLGGTRLRSVLAAAEVAIALLLLSGAGLLVESYRKLQAVDPGFEPTGVLAITAGLAASEHAPPDRRAQFYSQALEQFRALPGVVAVGAVNHVPLAGDRFGIQFTVEGAPAPAPGSTPNAVYRVCMPGYFAAMRMKILQGRDFTDRDSESAPGVAVINAAAGRAYWPGQNPVGKRLRLGNAQSTTPWLTVVGVIADVKQTDWKGPAESEIYRPFAQDPLYRHNPASFATMTLVVRAANAGGLAPAIREQIAAIDRNISVPYILKMDQVVRDITWQPRTSMTLILFFAGVASLLAAVGIYAVVSFVVAGRTQEIGVRMALGARRVDVLGMVVRQSLPPVLSGLAIGLGAALILTRLISSLLFGIQPRQSGVFAGAAAGLAAVSILASAIPAWRAARLNPLTALRHE